MGCGIHRVEKRKRQAVGGLQAEANRTANQEKNFIGSDIDYTRTNENIRLISSDNWLKDINKKIEVCGIKKIRKDAIMMLDGVYTASPDFFQDKTHEEARRYFEECLQFHIDHYCHGDRSLVINAVIHMDETTPHMQVASIPITDDDRLCAKEIMGNSKEYHHKQDLFHEEVTSRWGLERGEVHDHEHSRDHIDQMDWKAENAERKCEDIEIKTVKAVEDYNILAQKYNQVLMSARQAKEEKDHILKEAQRIEEALEPLREEVEKLVELKSLHSDIDAHIVEEIAKAIYADMDEQAIGGLPQRKELPGMASTSFNRQSQWLISAKETRLYDEILKKAAAATVNKIEKARKEYTH